MSSRNTPRRPLYTISNYTILYSKKLQAWSRRHYTSLAVSGKGMTMVILEIYLHILAMYMNSLIKVFCAKSSNIETTLSGLCCHSLMIERIFLNYVFNTLFCKPYGHVRQYPGLCLWRTWIFSSTVVCCLFTNKGEYEPLRSHGTSISTSLKPVSEVFVV